MNQVTSLKPQVRTAIAEDEVEVCRLLMLANAENAVMESDTQKVYYHIWRFLNGDKLADEDPGPRGVFGVIGPPGGKLEGVCMLAISCFWYSHKQHIEEFLVFVDPEYRKGAWRHGLALVEWAKERSRKTGLPLITGIISNHRTEAKCRLYRRHLPKVGEFFFYDGTDKANFYADNVTGPGSMVVVGGSSKAA